MPSKHYGCTHTKHKRTALALMLLGIVFLGQCKIALAQNETKAALDALGSLLNKEVKIEKEQESAKLDSLINYDELRANHSSLVHLYYQKALYIVQRGERPHFQILKCLYSGLHCGLISSATEAENILSQLGIDQEGAANEVERAYGFLIRARNYLSNNEWEESVDFGQQAMESLSKPSALADSIKLILFNLQFSNFYYLQRFPDARDVIYQALSTYTINYGADESYTLAAIHNNVGIIEKKFGNYDIANQHYLRAIQIKESLNLEDISRIVLSKSNLCGLYAAMGEYHRALSLIHECESLPKELITAITYINVLIAKSRLFRGLGDYEKSIQCGNMALNEFTINEINDDFILSKIYRELGVINSQSQRYEDALGWFIKEERIIPKARSLNNELSIVSNLAYGYHSSGNLPKAKLYYEKGIEIVVELYGENSENNISDYVVFGDFLCEYGEAEAGKKYLKKALGLSLTHRGTNADETAWAYEFLAQHTQDEDLSRSIELFDRAISILARQGETATGSLPEVSALSAYQAVELFRVVDKKASALEKRLAEKPGLQHLMEVQKHFVYLVDLMEKTKTVQLSDASKMEVMAKNTDIYRKAVTSSLELYQQSGDLRWAETAFNIAERSKAGLLYEQIRESEARNFAGIPDSLINKEVKLRQDIATFQKLIYEEKKADRPDSLKLHNWEKRVLQMQSAQEQLVLSFERYYPDYYQYKFDNRVYSMQEIRQQLKQSEAMIEYFVSDDLLVAFCITQDGIRVHQTTLRKPLEDFIAHLPNQQSLMMLVSDPEQVYRNYIQSAYALYEILLQPFEKEIKGRKLIIIPDGQLGYISFESLLMRQSRTKRINYRDLDYVLNDHSLSYAYSAALLLKSYDRQPRNPRGELLAFAPAVFDPSRPLSVDVSQFTTRGKELANLPQTLFEVASIGKILKGKILMQEEATESMFKSIAANYRILHIATHGLVDNEQPMYSKLAFFQDGDDKEDGFLNTYELFNMKLNAEMAVLSACNTGYGKHVRGEGLMTLARGFMYSGVPSLVITLWKVEDKATAAIMEQFYVYLKEGMTKDDALRMAKLDYIQNTSSLAASPYFWSSFISIGDNSPISFRPSLFQGWMWAIPATLVLLAFMFIARRKFHLF